MGDFTFWLKLSQSLFAEQKLKLNEAEAQQKSQRKSKSKSEVAQCTPPAHDFLLYFSKSFFVPFGLY